MRFACANNTSLLAQAQQKRQPLAVSIFHLSVKPISRANGRSATAAAAYRAGAEIRDERTGEVHDYTRKGDIEHSEILVPPGAPAWAEDRSALWNAAEAAENRKDARVARDYEVAIPKELTRAQGIALVRDFSQSLADRYGVAVDFNVHRDQLKNWDGSEKGYQAYHAHILTSTRKLGRDGFGAKADPELSDTKRKSLGLDTGASEVGKVRERWEIAANRHLEQASQSQRIDRRSLEAQGIDREPTVHLGPIATDLERRGIRSDLGEINRRIEAAWLKGIEERKESAGVDRSMLDTSGDLAKAIRERDQAQGRAHERAQEQARAEMALKGQAAEAAKGVAALRERFAQRRKAPPGRTPADDVLERLKATVEAKRGQGTTSDNGRKTDQAERSQEPQPKPPDKSKNGPDYER